MPLQLLIPNCIGAWEEPLRSPEALRERLKTAKSRSIAFCGENAPGFVVYSASGPVPEGIVIKLKTNDELEQRELHSALIKKPVLVDTESGTFVVWRFEVPIKEYNGGPLIVSATLVLPLHSLETEAEAPQLPQDSLLSDLNLDVQFRLEPKAVRLQEIPQFGDSVQLELDLMHLFVLKLRSTKAGGRHDVLLTTLSIEASEETLLESEHRTDTYRFRITAIDVSFRGGTVETIGADELPVECSLNDVFHKTYKIVSNDYLDKQMKHTFDSLTAARPIGLAVRAQPLKLDAGVFRPLGAEVVSLWTPFLDFGLTAPPISNSLRSASNQLHVQVQSHLHVQGLGIHRPGPRPGPSGRKLMRSRSPVSRTQLSFLTAPKPAAKKPYMSSPSLPAPASSVTVNLTTNTNSSLTGLNLTFCGSQSIELGKIANWRVQAINHTSSVLNLSLIVKNQINLHPMFLQSNSSGQSATLSSDKEALFQSRQQLYNQYNRLKVDTGGVVVLTNDIRLGPIEVDSVFEADFEIIGISKGIYNLNGLKVFDVATGDGIDFGKLVEVFVT